jgi:hypothetical protein
MTDVMANLIVDVHPSNAKLTLFLDGNYFLSASTLSEYSLLEMVEPVLAEGTTSSVHTPSIDCCKSWFAIPLHGK